MTTKMAHFVFKCNKEDYLSLSGQEPVISQDRGALKSEPTVCALACLFYSVIYHVQGDCKALVKQHIITETFEGNAFCFRFVAVLCVLLVDCDGPDGTLNHLTKFIYENTASLVAWVSAW
jgi:hypothetical protein